MKVSGSHIVYAISLLGFPRVCRNKRDLEVFLNAGPKYPKCLSFPNIAQFKSEQKPVKKTISRIKSKITILIPI